MSTSRYTVVGELSPSNSGPELETHIDSAEDTDETVPLHDNTDNAIQEQNIADNTIQTFDRVDENEDYLGNLTTLTVKTVCPSLISFHRRILCIDAILTSGTFQRIPLTIKQIISYPSNIWSPLMSKTARIAIATAIGQAIHDGEIQLYVDTTTQISAIQSYLRSITLLMSCQKNHIGGERAFYWTFDGNFYPVNITQIEGVSPIDAVRITPADEQEIDLPTQVHPLTIISAFWDNY
jgi:hypothetical protein